jgi:hypothetical protein
MQALPEWRLRDEASMRWVGSHASQVRHGVCPHGVATRPGARTAGLIGPEALAKAGVLPAKGTGMTDTRGQVREIDVTV